MTEPVTKDELSDLLAGFQTFVRLDRAYTKDGPTAEDPEKEAEKVVAVFQFSEQGFGFGEIAIVQTKEGCFVDTECMSRDKVKRYLCALVDNAITDTEEDPEKHRRYNRATGTRCSDQCRICYPKDSE